MSPEQILGAHPDSRSDVWAFGCVLYEILTGRPAFAGDDPGDTMGFVTRTEPEWTLIPALTPSSIVTVLRRCLRKRAELRFHRLTEVLAPIRVAIGEEGAFGALRRKPQLRRVQRWASEWEAPGVDADRRADDTFALGILNRIRNVVSSASSHPRECPEPLESALAFVFEADGLARYREALERLSARDRELIVSRVEQDANYYQIASRLSLPNARAAYRAVWRALRRLIRSDGSRRPA